MQRPWLCLLLQSSPWVGPGEWGGVAAASRTLAPSTNHQRPLKKNNACKRAANWTSCSAAALDVSASTCFFLNLLRQLCEKNRCELVSGEGLCCFRQHKGPAILPTVLCKLFHPWIGNRRRGKKSIQCHFSALLSDANLIQWQFFFCLCSFIGSSALHFVLRWLTCSVIRYAWYIKKRGRSNIFSLKCEQEQDSISSPSNTATVWRSWRRHELLVDPNPLNPLQQQKPMLWRARNILRRDRTKLLQQHNLIKLITITRYNNLK